MIVRITTPGPQEAWHHDVVGAYSDGGYLSLKLSGHPSLVHYWLGSGHARALFCESGAEVTEALREEKFAREHHEMDALRRI